MEGEQQRVKTKSQWVAHVEHLLDAGGDPSEEAKRWRRQSVYRVPAYIKHCSSYSPQLLSLGPFHHGVPELRPAEEHKERALLHLIRRCGGDGRRPGRLGSLVASLEVVVVELQEAYQGLDAKWRDDPDGFLKMMVLDGCFLLEVMRAAALRKLDGGEVGGGYAANDPVFSRHGELYVFPYVRRDMLMVENQLPLLVLQRIVAFVHGGAAAPEASDDAINNMVLNFVSMIPDPPAISGGGGLALDPLDVCHRSLLHGPPPRPCHTGRREEFVPSATELDQAGVRFRPSRTRSLHDISFHRGTLRISRLAVDDTTEHKLFSLMAFEQLHTAGDANEVTAYVFFMDNVIKSGDDARLLGVSGVVENGLGSDKAVAEMFNRLANEAVHREVNAYREKRWNEWRASLVRNHAGNPWAIISLVVALVLLVLTVVQTVYTVLPYYQDRAASCSEITGEETTELGASLGLWEHHLCRRVEPDEPIFDRSLGGSAIYVQFGGDGDGGSGHGGE